MYVCIHVCVFVLYVYVYIYIYIYILQGVDAHLMQTDFSPKEDEVAAKVPIDDCRKRFPPRYSPTCQEQESNKMAMEVYFSPCTIALCV